MKDIQKIKEFFSKPLDEASSTEKFLRKLGWAGEDWTPQEFASQIKKLPDSTLISWAKSNKGIGKGIPNTPLAFQQKLVKIEMDKRGLSLDEAKSEDSYEVVWTDRDYKKHSKVFKNDPKGAPDNAKKKAEAFKKSLEDKDKKSKEGLYRSIDLNEAKEEDKVDTITMDIPLFLRMLEYSREDASQDMDLHDVTEKANKLGKEKGILSMEDYDAIVGAAEEIDEARRQVHPVVMQSMTKNASNKLKQSKLSSAEYQEVKKLKDFKASDWKWNADEDLYTKVNEASDYMKRRKAMDDYFVSKKDKPKKSYNPTPSGKTDYMKRREKDLAEAILAKLKK